MSPLTFAMSTATSNSAQTFSYVIPPNSVGDHLSSLSHCYRITLIVDYIIPDLIQQHDLCYDCSETNPAQTRSCLIPPLFCLSTWEIFIPHSKIYVSLTTGNTPNARSSSFNCFLPSTMTSTKATSQLKPVLNF